MTKTKRIILATFLTIATILLIIFGIKHNTFKTLNKAIQTEAAYGTNPIYHNQQPLQIQFYGSNRQELDQTTGTQIDFSITETIEETNPGEGLKQHISFHGNPRYLYDNQFNFTYTYNLQPDQQMEYSIGTQNTNPITTIQIKQIDIIYSKVVYTTYQISNNIEVYFYYANNNITTYQYTTIAYQNLNEDYGISFTHIVNRSLLYIDDIQQTYNQIQTQLNNAYQSGAYDQGDAINNVIPVESLMLKMLTLPFTFINQAFNVTLWPNTAYELNIANFIKGLIAILTIIFVIRLFITGLQPLANYTGGQADTRLKNAQTKKTKVETRKLKKE